MASLQASLRGQTMGQSLTVDQVMQNINSLIWLASPENRYATLFYAEYDPHSRSLTYSNGGHNAPFWIRQNGETARLVAGGAPVGLLEQAKYTCERIEMQIGDLLVFYTDGISEAMNANGEEWGEDRLIQLLHTNSDHDPELILSAIFD